MHSPAPARDARKVASLGVPSVDDILNGGLPCGHMYLLEGEPGAGKTTLALQFLLEGIKQGETVLYITLSESHVELKAAAASHGWDISEIDVMELMAFGDKVDPDSLYTVLNPGDVELTDTLKVIRERVDSLDPKRVVLDSLSEVRLLAGDPLRFRREILVLKQYFLEKGTTVLMLDDRTADHEDLQIHSLVHGIIKLERMANEFGSERRRLTVTKLRATRFRGGYHDYKIIEGGLVAFPRLVAAEHRAQQLPGTLLSGVSNLDDLLGGGLDHGTSTIVMGPAGSGKSTIVTMYAIAAVNAGDKVAMYLFDENVGTLFARCKALEMPLEQHIESGMMTIQQIDPAEMSPGELIQHVRDAVTHRGVKHVVIDSLIGLLNAMPEERLLTVQLHELLSYLNQLGVTTLMTIAQHGLVGPMTSPADLSYLADTLLLLRFFEADGEVRGAISVMKRRTGLHERTIREFQITKGGVVVGPPMRGFRGVLTGVPTYTEGAVTLMERKGAESFQ
ncbi:MAG: ATPase domain-containing protein [Fimbriimonas sp.]